MYLSDEDLRKVQLLQLKSLLEVKRICEKYDIKYFLIGGSLIGAIRHKGFIPWDDDIDIGMLREEYDKFFKVVQTELGADFFLQSSATKINHATFCGVIIRLKNTKYRRKWETNVNSENIGIAIDVFAYDKIPDSYLKGFLFYYTFQLLHHVYMLRIGDYPSPNRLHYRVITRIASCFLFWLKTKKIHTILDHYHERYKNIESDTRILLMGAWGLKERHLFRTMSNLSTATFEGIIVPVPADYDTFLTEQYGDYMTPPPKEKQTGRHSPLEFDFGPYQDIK
ncbi:LPS cholinephosphotransferase [Spirochaetia bacterium]|nr:LPS cholinephosphotransferase [Spirochaetia bacterium]